MPGISVQERAAIRETFARILADHSTEARVRATMDLASGRDERLWHELAQAGFIGLLAPVGCGGIAGGALELEAIMEEAGAALLTGPYFSSAVLATSLLAAAADSEASARLLPAIASGEAIATVALTGGGQGWGNDDVAVTAQQDGAGWALDGVASYVTDGAQADIVLVLAHGPDGIAAYEITDRGGITAKPQLCVDRTMRLARLTFTAARAVPVAGPAAIARMRDMALLGLVAGQVGAARRAFEQTVDYIGQRVQFGRVIGSFQALKHMVADALLELESAVSAARAAAEAMDQDRPDAAELLALAGFVCSDALIRIANDSVQLHGGIAFTWEHSAHLYLRRARATAQLLGSPDHFRGEYLALRERAA